MFGPSKKQKLLNQRHQDIRISQDRKVEYLVVGAYALAVHGFVRATGDIDLWVKANVTNAQLVFDSLIEIGGSKVARGKLLMKLLSNFCELSTDDS